jgi:polysaccharide chain length determinant protein (PEP-CTERM system associated)
MSPRLDPILDQARGVWRFRWLSLSLAVAIALIGWLIVFSLPDRYQAQAKVLVDTRTALKPVLEGLATSQDVSVQLNYVRQALLASPQLSQIAEQVGALPSSGISPARRQALLDALRNRIELTVDTNQEGGTTYGIAYQDVNRARALRLVQVLTSTLINETLGGSKKGSEHAQQFLKAQIAGYENRLQTAEDRLAAFKTEHFGLLPTEQGGYFDQLVSENQAIESLKTKLVVAESRRKELERELHGNVAISSADATPVVGPNGVVLAGGNTLSQIEQVQARLNRLLLKYTDQYPGVIAAREELAALKRRWAAQIAALKRGDASAAALSGASANPVYQSTELALGKADVTVADLHTELVQHQRKARELQRLLDKTPKLEAQYSQLSRDYAINKKQYAALLASYDKARLGEKAGNDGAVRFEIVQPPAASYMPVWPHRGKFLTVVLMLALGAGGALGYQLNRMRPVVGSPAVLKQLTGIPVVAVVGSAFPTRTKAVSRREARRFAFALAGLLAAFVAVVILSHMGVRLGGAHATPAVHT